ncbi:MAG: FeoB-associated Cys-rich membrane protein [Desulfococcaceae bacterium]
MQNFIVALIILVAAVYVGLRFYRSTRSKNACGCGCDGCGAAKNVGGNGESLASGGCADIQNRTAGEIADEMARRENGS